MAAIFSPIRHPSRECAKRGPPSSICWTAWVCRSIARRKVCSTSAAFAGASTGQQLLYALDEQVRRFESEGKVKKYEGWEFLSAVLDSNGAARGITALDLRTMELRSFPADAINLATGGIGAIFGKSTNSVVCTGSAH